MVFLFQTMFLLLVILFVIKLYARNNTFKWYNAFTNLWPWTSKCQLVNIHSNFISFFNTVKETKLIFSKSKEHLFPGNIYLFKDNNRNSRKRCEICLKLTIKTPERRHWRRYGVFIVNFEHISHFFQMFLLLTLNKQMLAKLVLLHAERQLVQKWLSLLTCKGVLIVTFRCPSVAFTSITIEYDPLKLRIYVLEWKKVTINSNFQ